MARGSSCPRSVVAGRQPACHRCIEQGCDEPAAKVQCCPSLAASLLPTANGTHSDLTHLEAHALGGLHRQHRTGDRQQDVLGDTAQ
jgi:hypothetical protein